MAPNKFVQARRRRKPYRGTATDDNAAWANLGNIDDLKAGLNLYLAEKGFASVRKATGLALDTLSPTTDTLERDTVIFPQFNRDRCIGCGRCEISCMDGGHQAIHLDENRMPKLNGKQCVGCHLCILICPQRAIAPGAKRIRR